MKALITGSTGFAGRTLAATLRAQGHEVRELARSTGQGDVRDEGSVRRAAEGCELVFHCAALRDPRAPRAELEAVNLVGTENTLSACRSAGVRRMVFLSTADVTRGLSARSYADEGLAHPSDHLDPCTETRALAEDLVVAASDRALETVTLRPGWIWGAGDTCLAPRLAAAVRAGRFRWIDGGKALCATTHVRNLTAAMVLAATASEAPGGVYYLTDDERITVKEFLTRLAGATGVKLPRRSVPFEVALVMAWLDERLSKTPGALVCEVVDQGRSANFNVQGARKELGYAPVVGITEGLRELSEG